jgi:dethiobiotin synthetase
MKSTRKTTPTIFITGTDTGAGKTLLTAILLADLRAQGVDALAMKPFCSGGSDDAKLLNSLQNQVLKQSEITPFYYPEPVAPLVSARKRGQKIGLKAVLASINRIKRRCECLLIEGSGGILVPLGEKFSVRDLITKLGCPVIVAARNRLGVINQTRLSVENLQHAGVKHIIVVLMGVDNADISIKTNEEMITKLVAPVPVLSLPFLGKGVKKRGGIKKCVRNFKKTIAQIRESANFMAF